MFKYPSGRTVMNSLVWLYGVLQLMGGVFLIVISFTMSSDIALDSFASIPYFEYLMSGSIVTIGIVIIAYSFVVLMFAEIHMYSNQNNKMMKKMFDKIK